MKNKLYLSWMILALVAFPKPAHADVLWSLFQFLFGGGRAAYQSCAQDANGHYTCNPNARPRLETPAIQAGRERMRAAALDTVDERRGCQQHRNGCVDCPGSQHAATFRSSKGHAITVEKPGQNYLKDSVRRVLMRMADDRGQGIRVTSGYRSCDYQRSTHQGVPKSQHLLGNAADFLFSGGGPTHSALAAVARNTLNSMHMGGGTGTYCSAPAHVDTGNTRQWNWCKSGRRRMRK